MSKKLLLALGAAAIAVSAQAATYAQGEAFAYEIAPGAFTFGLAGDAGEDYVQYPADALRGQADMEYGFGLASAWFNGKKFDTPADADAYCPVVADPFNPAGFAIRMQTTSWDGFGNFNFALPEVNEPCRVRVIYRVDETQGTNWGTNPEKPFHVKIMHNGDQDDCITVKEDNAEFFNNPGWRVADFVMTLDADYYFLSLLWDAGGLSCGRNIPFYVEEVSVVPMSKLSGYTAPADGASLTVTNTMPDLVKIGQAVNNDKYDVFAQGDAFGYDIDPSFSFDLAGDWGEEYVQYPADALRGQADMEYGFGLASAWFNGKKFDTPADANAYCPVVEDPFNEGGYAIRMQTTSWDGFGNFNFALPEYSIEPCRVRVIYRVDETQGTNWGTNPEKPFHVKIMHNGDQDDCLTVKEDNAEFWNNPGWRVAEFVMTLDADYYFMSLLWDAGGLSCGRNIPFYVEEVSVVPVSKLEGYTAPADGASLTVVTEMPKLVKIDRTGQGGITDLVKEKASISALNGGIAVKGYEGSVEVYNLMGGLVAKTRVNGDAFVAVPQGIVLVKAGNTVAKVIVR